MVLLLRTLLLSLSICCYRSLPKNPGMVVTRRKHMMCSVLITQMEMGK